MYGDHVHQAVLDAGLSTTAATVHLIDAEYDTGPVIAVRNVPVQTGDTITTLRDRVQRAERDPLVQLINDRVAQQQNRTRSDDAASRARQVRWCGRRDSSRSSGARTELALLYDRMVKR